MDSVLVNSVRTDIGGTPHKVIYNGALRISDKVETAQSADVNRANWSFSPSNSNTLVDRSFQITMRVRVTSGVGGEKLFVSGTPQFSPTSHPIATVTTSCELKINGTSIVTQPSEYVKALLKYTPEDQDNMADSLTPNQQDQFLDFADWKDPLIGGDLRNVLTTYGNNPYVVSRGGFSPVLKDVNNEWAEYIFTENIHVSPLLHGQSEGQAMYNVTTLDLTLAFNENLNRMFSVDSTEGTAPTSLIVTLVGLPFLQMTYLDPNASQEMAMKDTQVLPYSHPLQNVTQVNNLASGASLKVVTNNFTIGSVPSALYCFARRSRTQSTFTETESYARIERLSVRWNNETSLLNSKDAQALYRMCVQNGSRQSWKQFNQFVGSVVKVDFSKDIGLKLDETIGSAGNYQIQVECDIVNQHPTEARDFEFYVIYILEGQLFITVGGSSYTSLGGIRSDQVIGDHKAELNQKDATLHAGSFFGDFKKGFNSVVHFAEGAVKTLAPLAPLLAGSEVSAGSVLGGSSVSNSLVQSQLKPKPVRKSGRKSVLRS